MTDRSEGASRFSFFARHLRILPGVALVLAGATGRLDGQSYRRVADLNPGAWWEERGRVCSSVNGPVIGEFAGILLADGRGSGCEVWTVDAVAGEIEAVADLGEFGAGAGELFGRAGGLAYFEGSTSIDGMELWRSDGTAEGTFRLFESSPGYEGIYWWFWLEPGAPTTYFATRAGGLGRELWRTDGTREGTALVRDIWPGPESSVEGSGGVHWNGLFFFVAADGVAGPEVWRTDGTSAGTWALTSFPYESPYDAPIWLGSVPSAMLWLARHDGHMHLWRTDGTIAGTAEIWSSPEQVSSEPAFDLSTNDDRALFALRDVIGVTRLWTTDGTAGGTLAVPGAEWSEGWVDWLAAPVGERWLFVREDVVHGAEPWVTDGVTGAALLVDVLPGPDGSVDSNGDTTPARFGDALLLQLDDGTHGLEIWRTDGTPPGTALVADVVPGAASSPISFLGETQGRELFVVQLDFSTNRLWGTDGTPAGTAPIAGVGSTQSPSYPRSLVDAGGLLYLAATAEEHDPRPWRTDGSEQGTLALAGDLTGFFGSTDYSVLPDESVVANTDGEEESLVWSSAGTEIVPLEELSYGCGPRWSCGLGHAPPTVGDVALFSQGSEPEGWELWATDGTPEGTGLWLDLVPGPEDSSPRQFVAAGDEVWFTALDADGDEWAWRSAGTPATTQPFAPLGESFSSWDRAEELWPLDAGAGEFFVQRDAFDGWELWFSPGTGELPTLLRVGLEGASRVGAAGGRMLFSAAEYKDPGVGWELWASDGTPAGTRLVRDIWSGEVSSGVGEGVELGGRVLFRACEPVGGCELWSSDGTTQGTERVLDIAPGPASSFPSGLSRIDGSVYFGACELEVGCEPWITDGTAAGTRRLSEIAPGRWSSLPLGVFADWDSLGIGRAPRFVRHGTEIYFAADDGTGAELWAMAPADLFYDGFESGDFSRWSDVLP